MRKRISFSVALVCLCAATAFARQESRRDFQRTVPLPAGRSFSLDHSFGNVSIRTQARAEAGIRAAIQCSADTEARAREFCDQIEISVQDGAGGVSVRTRYPSEDRGRNRGFRVDYDITVPAAAPLDIRNRFGRVIVADPQAGALIHNGNGDVQVTDGRGRLQIENSFGNVEVRRNAGDLVIRNGNGDVISNDVSGAAEITNRFGRTNVANVGGRLAINSNNGAVEATNVAGPASIQNSFGSVTVTGMKSDVTVKNQNGEVRAMDVAGAAELDTSFSRVSFSRIGKAVKVFANNTAVAGDSVGESASVQTSFANVDLRDVKGGARVYSNNTSVRLSGIGAEVDVKTTFNGTTVTDAEGPITVENQNGSVTVDARTGQRCQPISLRTTFGPIRVGIPGAFGYNVSAKTSFGRIRSEVDITGTVEWSSDSLTGRIAGGGCDLRLMGQNGNIEIVKRP